MSRLQGVNGLWMGAEIFNVCFDAVVGGERLESVEGGCEACILAVVGGNERVLEDLRASMLGRKKKMRPAPRLLGLVEEWIKGTGRSDAICKESDELGRKIRGCRRQLQMARRQKEKYFRAGIVDVDGEDEREGEVIVTPEDRYEVHGSEKDAGNEHDFEGSIIEFYANRLRSTVDLRDLHQTFRDSIVFNPRLGTFHRVDTEPPADEPPMPKHQTWYSESVYSTDNLGGPSTRKYSETDLQRRSSEKQAQAYRKLLGIEEEEEKSGR